MRIRSLLGACCLWLGLSGAVPPEDVDPEGLGVVGPGEVLIVGEVHGTNELPKVFLSLVDRLLTRSKMVSVGLEMPPSAGLAACEGGLAGQALGKFWVRRVQDGRSSQAMRALVCELKKRVRQGKVRLLYLGGATNQFGQELARRIKIETEAGRPTAILIGNFHARNTPQSVTSILRSENRKVTSLTASSKDATAWNCTAQGCSAQPTRMEFCTLQPTGSYILTSAIRDRRWDGCVALGKVTSSPPVQAGLR